MTPAMNAPRIVCNPNRSARATNPISSSTAPRTRIWAVVSPSLPRAPESIFDRSARATPNPAAATSATKLPRRTSREPTLPAFLEKSRDRRMTVPKSAMVAAASKSCPNSPSLSPASFRIGATNPRAVAASTIPTNRGERICPAELGDGRSREQELSEFAFPLASVFQNRGHQPEGRGRKHDPDKQGRANLPRRARRWSQPRARAVRIRLPSRQRLSESGPPTRGPWPQARSRQTGESESAPPSSAMVAAASKSCPNSPSLSPASFRIGATNPRAVAASTIPTNRGERICPAELGDGRSREQELSEFAFPLASVFQNRGHQPEGRGRKHDPDKQGRANLPR